MGVTSSPSPVDVLIAQARHTGHPPVRLAFPSFAEAFHARSLDPAIASQPFFTYLDEDQRTRRCWTYAQFGEAVNRTVTVLRERLHVRRGDRVATLLFNHDQTVVIYFAVWVAGAAIVPINGAETTERKRYILDHSEASVLLYWKDHAEEVEGIRRDLPHMREVVAVGDADDPAGFEALLSMARPAAPDSSGALTDQALIVYTSGTTGPPKGVVLTTENLLIDADGIASWHGFTSADCLMCVLPIHHVNGIVVTLLTPWYGRARAVLTRKFKTDSFWTIIRNEGVTCASVVPTVLEYLLEGSERPSAAVLGHFDGVICGAGPLLKETARRFEDEVGVPIHHGYGLSETTCYSCFLPRDLSDGERHHWLTAHDFPSIGVPMLPHNDMAILDDEGRPLPEGEGGEICIRGQTVCSGYWKRPDANEAAFRWGWYRSGDEGYFLPDRRGRPFFFITGRRKELIIRGGVNLSPLEVDEVLRGYPAVQFAMVVPFENRYYGEEIAAYVVVKEGVPRPCEQEVRAYCRGVLPFAKCPKVILYGNEVPYTTTGKPKRLELARRLASSLVRYRDVQFREEGGQRQ